MAEIHESTSGLLLTTSLREIMILVSMGISAHAQVHAVQCKFQLLWVATTSVTQVPARFGVSLSFQKMHFGMEMAVSVRIRAALLTTHHGFAKNFLNQLLMILKYVYVQIRI